MTSGYTGTSIPLVPGTLRGFRAWRLIHTNPDEPPVLKSVVQDTYWESTSFEADCAAAKDPTGRLMWSFTARHVADGGTPQEECECGIYACHTTDGQSELRDYLDFTSFVPVTPQPIVPVGSVAGVIEASGKVILGRKGFRAQRAKIVALVVGGPSPSPEEQYRWVIVSRHRNQFNGTWIFQVQDRITGVIYDLAFTDEFLNAIPSSDSILSLVAGEMEKQYPLLRASTRDRLRERYPVPVYDNIDRMLADFPPIPVDHLLPEEKPPTWWASNYPTGTITINPQGGTYISHPGHLPVSVGFTWQQMNTITQNLKNLGQQAGDVANRVAALGKRLEESAEEDATQWLEDQKKARKNWTTFSLNKFRKRGKK